MSKLYDVTFGIELPDEIAEDELIDKCISFLEEQGWPAFLGVKAKVAVDYGPDNTMPNPI